MLNKKYKKGIGFEDTLKRSFNFETYSLEIYQSKKGDVFKIFYQSPFLPKRRK